MYAHTYAYIHIIKNKIIFKYRFMGGEMVQPLGSLAALAEDPGSDPPLM